MLYRNGEKSEKEIFNNRNSQFSLLYENPGIIKKKETMTNKLATVDGGSQNDIYLESIPIMEKRLKDLKSENAEPSNFADISTNMTITKLTGLIENYGSFEILRQNSLSWINDTKSGIHRAKQNIDQMAEESIIYQDETFLINLLKVERLKYYFSKIFYYL